ncbi:MAG: 3-deoxy-8-phosphooctulonate synthase [Candidatus Alcyoniella australis]|nr:3-deoxy-8-phosphooctulonate synthase [Candidatus Alcyoniella australis]
MKNVTIGDVPIGRGHPLALICGPCVLEDIDVALRVAEHVSKLCRKLGVGYVFKASYEKDNRGSATGYLGPGLHDGLEQLAQIKAQIGVPVLSDIHRIEDIAAAAEVLDVLQIPAYLCQQTSLMLAAGAAGKPVNVKKGQFLAPENMSSAVGKLRHAGCDQVLLTERGSCFGYNRLVSDLRCIPIMQDLGCPVVYDSTHIVRIYGIPSADPRGGEPQFVPHLTRAAVAAGTNALFLEAHPEPSSARCDAASMIDLGTLDRLLEQSAQLAQLVRQMEVD